MKPLLPFSLLLPLLLLSAAPAAEIAAPSHLRLAGVLGNSGEQGATLVRFTPSPASGLGVVADDRGSLWDRAGEGRLNRYAPDGRLLASYPLPPGGSANARDTAVRIGDSLLLKIGEQLLTLPLDATPGTAPVALPVKATRLGLTSHESWAVAADGGQVFLVNLQGETKPVAELPDTPGDLAIGPGEGIYAVSQERLRRIDAFAPADASARGPWLPPGDRAQWLAGHWYGSAWHGTLRRFNARLEATPGVVLGGASGWFIGYVPGNHELNDSRGLAWLGGPLFAASGSQGILHLMQWDETDRRFTLLRRIGAIPACGALALDGADRIWFHSGFWEWDDLPDTPLRHSVPPADPPGCAGAAGLPGGAIVAPGIRWGKKALYYGQGDGPAKLAEDIPLPTGAIACTALQRPGNPEPQLLIADTQGQGRILQLNAEGKYQSDAGALELRSTAPIEALTSLAALNTAGSAAGSAKDQPPTLYAAAAGWILEFTPQAESSDIWQETRRWNASPDAPNDPFGAEIHLAAAEGRLWLADTRRQQVLCLDPATRRVLARFGEKDQAGDDLAHLDTPRTLAVRGGKAVVFDSGNQRLLRLLLESER